MAGLGRFLRFALCALAVSGSAGAVERIHTVVKGQTLGGIARRYELSVKELREANQLQRGAIIKVGQKLLIPSPGEAKANRTNADPSKPAEAEASGSNSDAPKEESAASPSADRPHKKHVVASGHTLGKIARRYNIRIDSLCRANGLRRSEVLRAGQTLVIPNGDDDPIIDDPPEASGSSSSDETDNKVGPNGMRTMELKGGPAYYFTPTGRGRYSMRPVLVYLHGRGGNPERDCQRWAPIARSFGWLVCPSGPVAYNGGRGWNNSWPAGQTAVMGAIQGLREKYGRRVQLFGNTLIGFSEGAYVAMNVGVREPRTFNRWLILGADTSYWGGSGLEALKDARNRVRRVVLITGERDQVVEDSRRVAEWLEKERVNLRVQTPDSLAHEVALEKMPYLYQSALRWLENGKGNGPTSTAKR